MFRWSVFYEMGMACDTIEEKAELWQAIMEYGLYGKEPPQKFKMVFVNIRFILDKSHKISEIRSQAWKKWWAKKWNQNAVKNYQKQAKQPKQAKTNKTSESDSNSYSYSNSISNDSISNKYLEYVYLSNTEYNKLIETYWKNVIDNEIENLNNYIWQRWKNPYKSHYYTILNRLRKAWTKKVTTQNLTTQNPTRRDDGVYDLDDFNSLT